MDKDLIKARLFLHAVLPQLEDVVAEDAEAKSIAAGWNRSIQLQVMGGPAARLMFENGTLKVHPNAMALPSLGLLFFSPAAVVKLFEEGKGTPIPWKGVWHLGLIKNFPKLTERMELYMKPTEAVLKDEKSYRLVVKLMMNTAIYAVKVLSETYPESIQIATHAPDCTGVVRALPDGPACHVIAKGGKLTVGKGEIPNPNLYMEFKDIDTAYGIFTGTVNAMAALGTGAVRIRGMTMLADVIIGIMNRIGLFLET